MNKHALIALVLLTGACGSNYEAPAAAGNANDGGMPAGHAAPASRGVPPGNGTVLETMNSGGYTYVRVDLGGGPIWAAGPETQVAVGDMVRVSGGSEMPGFHSNTLDRTFDSIWFVGSITKGGGAPTGKIDEDLGGSERSHVNTAGVAAGSVARVDGGQTVEEIFGTAADLAGKDVVVRGKVVKFNANIMGTNWLHLQDGTGAAGTNDLTVTTSAAVAVGDTVVVRGKLTTDKDFGAGYKYDVIIENADVTIE